MFVHKYSLSLGLKHKKTHASNKRRLTSRSAIISWSVPATRMTRHILHNVYAILHNVYFLKKRSVPATLDARTAIRKATKHAPPTLFRQAVSNTRAPKHFFKNRLQAVHTIELPEMLPLPEYEMWGKLDFKLMMINQWWGK